MAPRPVTGPVTSEWCCLR